MIMQKQRLVLIVPIFLLSALDALAAEWNVTQTTDIANGTVTFEQGRAATNNNARQGLNVINVAPAGDSVSDTTQTVTFSSGAVFNITQSGSGSGNVQSANYVAARGLSNLTQAVTGLSATMTQNVTGSNNIQALNYARSTTTASNVSQEVSGTQVTMDNSAVPAGSSGNAQYLNYLHATGNATGTLEQSVTLDTLTITGSASGSTNPRQGVNIILAPNPAVVSASTGISQNATITTLNVNGAAATPTAPLTVYINAIVAPVLD